MIDDHPEDKAKTNEEWIELQCNRYVNGQCNTLGCLRRGGYVIGNPVDCEMATCHPHEILQRLKAKGHE